MQLWNESLDGEIFLLMQVVQNFQTCVDRFSPSLMTRNFVIKKIIFVSSPVMINSQPIDDDCVSGYLRVRLSGSVHAVVRFFVGEGVGT